MRPASQIRRRVLILTALSSLLAACFAPRTTFVCKDRNALAIALGGQSEAGVNLEWAELIDVNRGMIVWRVEAPSGMGVASMEFRPEQPTDAPPQLQRGAFKVMAPDAQTLRLEPETRYEFLAKGSWWELAARVRFQLERCQSAATPGTSVEVP